MMMEASTIYEDAKLLNSLMKINSQQLLNGHEESTHIQRLMKDQRMRSQVYHNIEPCDSQFIAECVRNKHFVCLANLFQCNDHIATKPFHERSFLELMVTIAEMSTPMATKVIRYFLLDLFKKTTDTQDTICIDRATRCGFVWKPAYIELAIIEECNLFIECVSKLPSWKMHSTQVKTDLMKYALLNHQTSAIRILSPLNISRDLLLFSFEIGKFNCIPQEKLTSIDVATVMIQLLRTKACSEVAFVQATTFIAHHDAQFIWDPIIEIICKMKYSHLYLEVLIHCGIPLNRSKFFEFCVNYSSWSCALYLLHQRGSLPFHPSYCTLTRITQIYESACLQQQQQQQGCSSEELLVIKYIRDCLSSLFFC